MSSYGSRRQVIAKQTSISRFTRACSNYLRMTAATKQAHALCKKRRRLRNRQSVVWKATKREECWANMRASFTADAKILEVSANCHISWQSWLARQRPETELIATEKYQIKRPRFLFKALKLFDTLQWKINAHECLFLKWQFSPLQLLSNLRILRITR